MRGFQFFVVEGNNGDRGEVRTREQIKQVEEDARRLGPAAKVVPLLHRQARPLYEHDALAANGVFA